MRIVGQTRIIVAIFAGMASLGTASASSRCTHHDLVVQPINDAYHTKFKSNCKAPSIKVPPPVSRIPSF